MSATEALLPRPAQPAATSSQLAGFIRYCEEHTGLQFPEYRDFESFTMSQYRVFWSLFVKWSSLIYEGNATQVCVGDDCETAVFFPDLRINYAENLLPMSDDIALLQVHDGDIHIVFTYERLRDHVVAFANFLRRHGIQPGDRVAAIARNNWQVIVAALGTAAIGAVFSSCAYDMGIATILSRFQKVAPKILVANCAPQRGDAGLPLDTRISQIIAGLPTLTDVVAIDPDYWPTAPVPIHGFIDILDCDPDPTFVWDRFPFNHPLFIMFSSGTTGAPKCIMHGAGGTLIEHLKEHRLHGDLTSADHLFFQTSCGWMMWNWQLSALACGATVVLYDGPLKGPETLWEIVAATKVSVFGTNPAYLQFTEASGYAPSTLAMPALRSILSTGSILYPRQFDWIGYALKPVAIQSISGGTDMIGCFVLGNPMLPVHRGKAQCRSLGLDVRSLPPDEPIGELICANPFPSRPIGFYGEPDNTRYHNAYFAQNPGVWTHGDLIELTPDGATMHGRSDGVINIRGVRIGPAEIYRILQDIPFIIEAMAVEQIDETEPGGARLVLLVVLRGNIVLDTALMMRIRRLLAEQGNAMMVPAMIIQVPALPVTFSGKRSETAARDAINGRPMRNRAALMNPDCLDGLADKARQPILMLVDASDDLEASLCRLCEHYIGVTEISPTDNFLALGADSLAILSFLIAASEMAKTAVPLPTLIGVSTIRALISLMTGAAMPRINSPHSYTPPDLRPIEPRDYPYVVRLLDQGFQRKLAWQRIFEHPWQPDSVPRGFVIATKDDVVGFLGLIGARRTINGKSDVVANLTSWFVQPDYRGWSNALLAEATRLDITYTSLTPSKTSRRILRALGFDTLTASKLYSLPLMNLKTLGTRPTIVFDPVCIRNYLTDSDRAVLEDHARYECTPVLVIDRSETAFALIGRRHYRPYNYAMWRYSEVLYCNAPHVLYRHLERVTVAMARRQATIGLTFSHLQGIQARASVSAKTMFRSRRFHAAEMDGLYSELTLLPV